MDAILYEVEDYEITSNMVPFLLEGTTTCGKYIYARERGGTLRVELDGDVIYMQNDLYDFDGYKDLKDLTQHLFIWPERKKQRLFL